MRRWEQSLDALMRAHGRELYAYAFALTGRPGSADLLLENALVRTMRGRGPGSIEDASRLVQRAMRRALAHHRTRPERGGAPATALDEIARAPEHAPTDPASAMHWNVPAAREYVATHPVRWDADMLDQLLRSIASLPAAERACVVMRYLDGLSAEAIAVEVGLRPARVRELLRSAADRLDGTLAGTGLDPDEAVNGGSGFVVVSGEAP